MLLRQVQDVRRQRPAQRQETVQFRRCHISDEAAIAARIERRLWQLRQFVLPKAMFPFREVLARDHAERELPSAVKAEFEIDEPDFPKRDGGDRLHHPRLVIHRR